MDDSQVPSSTEMERMGMGSDHAPHVGYTDGSQQ
jgi:hypothetical protein